MESVVGIFNSLADARRGAAILQSLGISDKRISVLAPGTSEAEVEGKVATTETEQPGMGPALGGTIGGALGVAGGLQAGAAVASILVPGVGPVLAFGLIAAALLGSAGVAVGAMAGEALEEGIARGLPRDELYVYEDALRRGRSVVIAIVDDEDTAANARTALVRAGAESLDTARQEWWIGLRDAEQEHYTRNGGDFKIDEALYRLGFEAALHPDRRGRPRAQCIAGLREKYGADADRTAFCQGYVRGLRYHGQITVARKAA